MLLGAAGLAAADGDLSRALANSPDCRVEIILAWLAGHGHDTAAGGVMLAARIVGRLNAGGERAKLSGRFDECAKLIKIVRPE